MIVLSKYLEKKVCNDKSTNFHCVFPFPGKPGKGSYWTLDTKCDEMFENGNYRRRKRRPKQMISSIQKPSSTSSSIPLDDSSLSSSESNHNSLLISSHNDEEEIQTTTNTTNNTNYDRYSFLKIDSSDTKKRRRSPSPETQAKKIKTVSAFSSIDTLIAPTKESKSVDLSLSPCRNNNHNQHAYLSSIPPQYLSLLTNGFALNPAYNRHFSTN